MGYSLWGRKESDTTERLSLFHFLFNVGVHRLSFLPLSFLSREPPPFLDVQIPPDVLVAPRSHFPAQISIPSSKYPVCPAPSPLCVYMSVLYACLSIPSLEIGSSVPILPLQIPLYC